MRYVTLESSPERRGKTTNKTSQSLLLLLAGRLKKSPVVPCRAAVTMALWGRSPFLMVIPLWMCFGGTEALKEPEICYVLDGILFVYGLTLTALYTRVKLMNLREEDAEKAKMRDKKNAEEGIYTGLTHAADTYETIGMKK